jgi:flagellar basal body-associated protein FliL
MASKEPNPAETPAPKAEGAAPAPDKKKDKKRGLLLGGGALGLIALAGALALVAVPSRGSHGPKAHALAGPLLVDVSPSAGFQVNLAGDGGKHYLSLKANVEVEAFEEGYASARATHPLHQAKVTDAVLRTAALKTKGELDSPVGREVFRDELREALDPVLFPVHVGDPKAPEAPHAPSGLRPGRSLARATLRGLFHEHALVVDAAAKSVRLDDGTEVRFQGDENDLFVADARGRGVYVDVVGLRADFRGSVPVGTFGRVRNVYFTTFLTQ